MHKASGPGAKAVPFLSTLCRGSLLPFESSAGITRVRRGMLFPIGTEEKGSKKDSKKMTYELPPFQKLRIK